MNRESKSFLIVLMLGSTLLASGGQLLFKLGTLSHGLGLVILILAGVLFYGASTVAYLYALSRQHLSWTYSFVGLSYVFTLILSYSILGENVGAVRVVGVIAIMLGTAIIGLS